MNNSSRKKVFLGGTVNESKWRDKLIPMLEIDYFNPVVKEWNEAARIAELESRKNSDFIIYVITPKMAGVYSIAEAVDDSNKRPKQTFVCVLENDDNDEFTTHQLKALKATCELIKLNGATVCNTLTDLASSINSKAKI